MKIYTITLSPAYDIHAFTAHFEPFHENLASIVSRDAGGKGVNISRALSVNGIENHALIVVGKENSADFITALDKDGLSYTIFEKDGRIRENLTLHTSDSDETRISFSGFSVDSSVLDEISAVMDIDNETVVTFTGRVPDGISMKAVKDFLSSLKAKGARLVIDSRSFSLADLSDVKPWLIKPNQEEISEYLGFEVSDFEQCKINAAYLLDVGIENIMVSLGSKGAMLIRKGESFVATPPSIEPLSTIGAGDSSVAGFIAAYTSGRSFADCLRLAVAYGSAACLTAGTLPPLPKDVERIYSQITLQ